MLFMSGTRRLAQSCLQNADLLHRPTLYSGYPITNTSSQPVAMERSRSNYFLFKNFLGLCPSLPLVKAFKICFYMDRQKITARENVGNGGRGVTWRRGARPRPGRVRCLPPPGPSTRI